MSRFVGSLLNEPHQVQNITLPAHHMDKEGVKPTPRGFGFVTLLHSQNVDDLLHNWPWVRSPTEPSSKDAAMAQEAQKFGFRTISKARWEELRDEYLAYRQELLQQIATEEEAVAQISVPSQPSTSERREAAPPAAIPPVQTHVHSNYPIGCLVFVRNVQPETNKTTLRSLFTSAVGGGQEMLDYVDYNKGMDSVSPFTLDKKLSSTLPVLFASLYPRASGGACSTFYLSFYQAKEWS